MTFRIFATLIAISSSILIHAQDDGEKSNAQNIQEKIANMAAVMGKKAEYRPEYTFSRVMRMQITSTEKGGKKSTQSEFEMASEADQQYTRMEVISVDGKVEKGKNLIIMDMANKSMITLIEDKNGSKSGMAMGFDTDQLNDIVTEAIDENEDEFDAGNTSYQKTGKTKEILGYTCHEYTFDSETSVGTAWLTNEADMSMASFFGAIGSRGGKKNKGLLGGVDGYPEGLVMEMNAKDKKSNDTSEMRVIAIDLNASETTKVTDYNIMSFGG